MDAESTYRQLVALLADFPDFDPHPLPQDTYKWLARGYSLIQLTSDGMDVVAYKAAMDNVDQKTVRINGYNTKYSHIRTITAVLHRALAMAERDAPAAVQGSFIPAGGAFDAMMQFGKVVSTARKSVRIVDPYLDEKALSDFAVQATEGVDVTLLADEKSVKQSLKPAAERWVAQYKKTRPLECRLAPAASLHDRLVFIDTDTVWIMSQSLNGLAVRSHASIMRVEEELAKIKVQAYEKIWSASRAL